MTITCRNGKCVDKTEPYLDTCIDCNEAEQIEHDLLKNHLPKKSTR